MSHSVATVIISRSYLIEGSPFKGFKLYLAIKTASDPSVEVNKLLMWREARAQSYRKLCQDWNRKSVAQPERHPGSQPYFSTIINSFLYIHMFKEELQ